MKAARGELKKLLCTKFQTVTEGPMALGIFKNIASRSVLKEGTSFLASTTKMLDLHPTFDGQPKGLTVSESAKSARSIGICGTLYF